MSNVITAGRAFSAQDMERIGDAVAGLYIFPESAGGAVTPSSGLTVAVAAISANAVTINGTLETTAYAGGTVTADAADSNPRRDLVYYDQAGAVGIKKGTAYPVTSTTGPALPILDDDEIAVAELYIDANAVTISAGDITDRRQDLAYGLLLVGSDIGAESTTTSTGDLKTISNLGIATNELLVVEFDYRKAATANIIQFGVKLNSTELFSSGVGPATGATNEAQDGHARVVCGLRDDSNYLRGVTGFYGGSGATAQFNAALRGVNAQPSAAITSITITCLANAGSATVGVKNVLVYKQAVS